MPIKSSETYDGESDLESISKAIGFVVILWGKAEQSLDLVIDLLYNDLGGKTHAHRLPKMLEEKLKFIENCIANILVMHKFSTDVKLLIADYRKLSSIRHDVIHGAIENVSAINGGFKFTKLDFEKHFHVVREFTFESDNFPKLTEDLINLGTRTTKFAYELSDLT